MEEQETTSPTTPIANPNGPLVVPPGVPELRAVFDRVRTHLISQGAKARAAGAGGACVYRAVAEDGLALRCAVGCLIADAAYVPEVEHCGMSSLAPEDERWVPAATHDTTVHVRATALSKALNESGVPATWEVANLLLKLQSVHDSYPATQWRKLLDELDLHIPPASPPETEAVAEAE